MNSALILPAMALAAITLATTEMCSKAIAAPTGGDRASTKKSEATANSGQSKSATGDANSGKPGEPIKESGQKKHFDYELFSIEIPKESRIKHKAVNDFNLYRVYHGSNKVRLLIYAGDYPKFPLLKPTPDIQTKRSNGAKRDEITYTQQGKLVGREVLFKVPSRGSKAVDTRSCVVEYVHAVIPIGTPEAAAWTGRIISSIVPHDGFADRDLSKADKDNKNNKDNKDKGADREATKESAQKAAGSSPAAKPATGKKG